MTSIDLDSTNTFNGYYLKLMSWNSPYYTINKHIFVHLLLCYVQQCLQVAKIGDNFDPKRHRELHCSVTVWGLAATVCHPFSRLCLRSFFVVFRKFYRLTIGKNGNYFRLGTGPFALGTTPFTGGADSVRKTPGSTHCRRFCYYSNWHLPLIERSS